VLASGELFLIQLRAVSETYFRSFLFALYTSGYNAQPAHNKLCNSTSLEKKICSWLECVPDNNDDDAAKATPLQVPLITLSSDQK